MPVDLSLPDQILDGIDSLQIRRLKAYKSPTPEYSIASIPEKYQSYPKPSFAAVLVLLYHSSNESSGLRVLLTTRSKDLRSHPGQAALPGGKSDDDDETPIKTAFREALEEIALPAYPHELSQYIHVLALLPAQLSLFRLLVTPVVAYCSRPDLVFPVLTGNEAEVAGIFDHPLQAFLDPSIMLGDGERLVLPGEDWIYPETLHNTSDLVWLSGSVYRMHRFRSKATPIKGLTADILLLTAQIAYESEPTFERYPLQEAASHDEAIDWAFEQSKREGRWISGRVDNKLDRPTTFGVKRREEEDLGPYTPQPGATPRTASPAPPA